MFIPLRKVIRNLPTRSHAGDAINAMHVRRVFAETLAKTCPDLPRDVIARARADTYKNGVLTVKASGVVAAELSMRAHGLKRDINNNLGRVAVTKIRFKLR